MRIMVLLNEKAGTLADREPGAVASDIRAAFAHAGHTINLVTVKPQDMRVALGKAITARPAPRRRPLARATKQRPRKSSMAQPSAA